VAAVLDGVGQGFTQRRLNLELLPLRAFHFVDDLHDRADNRRDGFSVSTNGEVQAH